MISTAMNMIARKASGVRLMPIVAIAIIRSCDDKLIGISGVGQLPRQLLSRLPRRLTRSRLSGMEERLRRLVIEGCHVSDLTLSIHKSR